MGRGPVKRPDTARAPIWAAAWVLLIITRAPAAGADELLVAAAVSLREPLLAIARRYEASHSGDRITAAFGASSMLGAQIRAGARLDVFLSADERIVRELAETGHVVAASAFALARNRLVVIRAEDSTLRGTTPAELFGPDLRRIAIPGLAVPLGRYAREWLAERGQLEGLKRRLVVTEHARATLAAVELGHADLALVYATDARLARSAKLAYAIPDCEQPEILYTAVRVSGSSQLRAANDFLDFLRSSSAQARLLEAGFVAPPKTRARADR